jgi:hypothetical protein
MWIVAFVLGSMLACTVTCFKIGFIPNVIFIPYDSNITTIIVNESCIACGSHAQQQNYSGFNCFSNNNTCSMFPTYPVSYGLNTTMNTTFYFFELPPIGKREIGYEKLRDISMLFFFYFQKTNFIFKPLKV